MNKTQKKRNIIIMAILFSFIDLLIGYFMTYLWFFLFKTNIFTGILIILTWLTAGKYAMGQYGWAKFKIKELE